MSKKSKHDLPRRRDGKVNWSAPEARSLVRTQLHKGKTFKEIGRLFNISHGALLSAASKHGLSDLPQGWVYVSEVAIELGVDVAAAAQHAEKYGQVKRWSTYNIMRKKDARLLVAERGDLTLLDVVPEGYVTAQQVADQYGLSVKTARDWLVGMPHLRVRSGRSGVLRCYDPRDVDPILPQRFRHRPSQALSRKMLANACDATPSTVGGWVKAGCPVLPWKGRDGSTQYFDPSAVLTWLESRLKLKHTRAPVLRAYLEQNQKGQAA